jgi:hypothetical protein
MDPKLVDLRQHMDATAAAYLDAGTMYMSAQRANEPPDVKRQALTTVCAAWALVQ